LEEKVEISPWARPHPTAIQCEGNTESRKVSESGGLDIVLN